MNNPANNWINNPFVALAPSELLPIEKKGSGYFNPVIKSIDEAIDIVLFKKALNSSNPIKLITISQQIDRETKNKKKSPYFFVPNKYKI